MTDAPLLSYIVLSYNYEHYIGQTIRSILAQGVQDFEVVVVDDASSDASCAVVEGFGDPRIRLLRNERNLGGAGSYNKAVLAARGTWLVNLDADDWIEPGKAEAQLDFAARQPSLDVIGTWVRFHGADGQPHPDRGRYEPAVNTTADMNRVASWIGRNHLCRSSTMVRRAAHLRVGLDDTDMVRAPDYELWTRFLAQGSRIAVVPEVLTCYRLHARGVTHADPTGTLLELSWAMRRNLLPILDARGVWGELHAILDWMGSDLTLASVPARQRERLFGLMVTDAPIAGYRQFRELLQRPDQGLEGLGRRILAMILGAQEPQRNLQADIASFVAARDYWKDQADRWREVASKDIAAYTEARDYWKQKAEWWEEAARAAQAAREEQQDPCAHQRPIHRRAIERFSRFFRSS